MLVRMFDTRRVP